MTIGWSFVRMEQVYRFYIRYDSTSVIVEEFDYCLPRSYCRKMDQKYEPRHLPFDR